MTTVFANLASVVVGGVLVWFGSYLQHRWSVKVEERRNDAARIERERERIADLLIALMAFGSAVTNLSLAYESAGRGADVDQARFREYLADTTAFGSVLVRARVSITAPAARAALDDLWSQLLKMTEHLNLMAVGPASPRFQDDYRKFREVLGGARAALEHAALGLATQRS